ncbi:MAG TPA: Maf family protein [Candidatus Eisenbacteria bacterium]|jgi:septum formation protein|nr:Maf family protein [Candidatus Eisenbacteria bacterium]
MKITLFLASSSPRRRRILRGMGFSFRCLKPAYEERPLRGKGPASTVKAHALAKALSAAPAVRRGVVLGSDTIVFHGGRVIGKPADLASAFRMLGRLQGRWHRVYTGVALLDVRNGRSVRRRVFCETTRVFLKKMSPEEMARYFRRIGPLDKAGAYAIQSPRATIVREVRGSSQNAAGLPAERLAPILRRFLAKI